jgi:hypothetical protein
LQGERDEDSVDGYDVSADARALFESGPKRPGVDLKTYTNIFARRSFVHLRQVFQRFQGLAQLSIEDSIKDEMKGDDEKGFLALSKLHHHSA